MIDTDCYNVYTSVYTDVSEVMFVETAKIFTNGGSQAVRLPKSCRFDDDEVLVNRIGSIVILIPKNDRWETMKTGLELFTDDFLREEIEDLPVQERESL